MLPTVNRRGFFGRLFGGVVAALAGRSVWVGQAFVRGDIITVKGVWAVNPRTDEPTPYHQRFIVTQDVEAGTMLPIEVLHPPIRPSGLYRNCAVDRRLWPELETIHALPMSAVVPLSCGLVVPCRVEWGEG